MELRLVAVRVRFCDGDLTCAGGKAIFLGDLRGREQSADFEVFLVALCLGSGELSAGGFGFGRWLCLRRFLLALSLFFPDFSFDFALFPRFACYLRFGLSRWRRFSRSRSFGRIAIRIATADPDCRQHCRNPKNGSTSHGEDSSRTRIESVALAPGGKGGDRLSSRFATTPPCVIMKEWRPAILQGRHTAMGSL